MPKHTKAEKAKNKKKKTTAKKSIFGAMKDLAQKTKDRKKKKK